MSVLVRNRLRRYRVKRSALSKLAQHILTMMGEENSELSLELIGDRRMRRLNREFRGKDYATDVLAFPLRGPNGFKSPLLGDTVVSVPTAFRQARSCGHSLNEELVRLMVHGILHLLGYDHEKGEKEARHMARKEKEVLRRLKPIPSIISG